MPRPKCLCCPWKTQGFWPQGELGNASAGCPRLLSIPMSHRNPRVLPNRECAWSSTRTHLRLVHLGHVRGVASFVLLSLNTIRPGHIPNSTRRRLHRSFILHDHASRRKPDEPLPDPTCTFFLCPTYPMHQVSIRNQTPDAKERRTFMRHIQVAAHSEPMFNARKHLEKVARLVAHQDVFCATSGLERERNVFFCRMKKKGGLRVSSTVRVWKATSPTRAG